MPIRSTVTPIATCTALTLLTACGGGGGSDSSPDDGAITNGGQSNGSATLLAPASDQPIAIDADNVRRLAATVVQAVNGAGAMGSGEWNTGSLAGFSWPAGFDFSEFAERRFELGSILNAQGLADGVSENDCASSGTLRLETVGSDDGALDEGDSFSATFTDCTVFEGIRADGGFAFSIAAPDGHAFSPDASQLNITASDFSVQLPGRELAASGSFGIGSILEEGGRTLTLTAPAFSYQSADASFAASGMVIEKRIDEAAGQFSLSVAGTLDISNGRDIDGRLVLATVTPLSCGLDGTCTSGELTFTGDASRASLTVESGDAVLLRVYDADGQLEREQAITTSLEELRALLGEAAAR